MPGLTRRLRALSRRTLWGAGMMLALTGLATVEMESASFGHAHLADEHTTYHHHIYQGSHEHSEAPHDHGHDQDHHHGEDHEAPDPHDGDAPRRTATLSVALALFQPVEFSVLPVPLVDSTPLVSLLVLPRVSRPEGRPVPPRAPPVALPSPGSLS